MTRLAAVVLVGEQGAEDVTLAEVEFQTEDKAGVSSLAEVITLP